MGAHGGLLAPLDSDPAVAAALDDAALVRAMLAVEAALAQAGADVGAVPGTAAEQIARLCAEVTLDPAEIGAEGVRAGNPVVPLVTRLSAALPPTVSTYVHYGATSQDVLDTALTLCLRTAGGHIGERLAEATDHAADLAGRHRDAVTAARTLGQVAVPTTFGRKAAGWLVGLLDAADGLAAVVRGRLAVQLGGAGGTLAAYGERGPAVVTALARRLGLAEPVLPWHTDRQRVVESAGALAAVAAACGKVATDLVWLAQSEVAEVRLRSAGGSSTMPHKANPTPAVLARAAALRAPGLAATLLVAAGQHEHERAAGAWHAEWEPLRGIAGAAGAAASFTAAALDGLEVDPERMRANLDASGGRPLAESLAHALAPALGRAEAHVLAGELAAASDRSGRTLAEVALDDARVTAHLDAAVLAVAVRPESWLGAAGAFVDRALAAYDHRTTTGAR